MARRSLPPETAEIGDLIHVSRERGAFRITAWHPDLSGAERASFTAFGPVAGKSGNLKKIGGVRTFTTDRITKIQEKGE